MNTNLHSVIYRQRMLYGERLKLAMTRRSEMLGQEVTRNDIARVADRSVQNIGMILNNSRGTDQKLGVKAHAAVADYLKVSSDWLLNEEGPMEPRTTINAPTELTPSAVEIAVLFDMIPLSDKIRRAQAFNAASSAIMQVLQSVDAKK